MKQLINWWWNEAHPIVAILLAVLVVMWLAIIVKEVFFDSEN